MPKIPDLLARLCAAEGVSGREDAPAALFAEAGTALGFASERDCLGNTLVYVNAFDENRPTCLLDAHADEIGMLVTGYAPGGFLKFTVIGLDPRTLPAREVTVHGREPLFGSIASLPPHVQRREDMQKAFRPEDLSIDTGLSDETLRELVPLGSPVTLRGGLVGLLGDRIAGCSLDDRAGLYVLLRAAETLQGKELPFNLVLCASFGEEVGLRGIRTVAHRFAPAWSFVVDVTHARTPDSDPVETFPMGKGPTVGIGPHISRELTALCRKAAEDNGIPYLLEPLSGGTGTNLSAMHRGCGLTGALISIPIKYMHTPCETAALGDIEAAAQLLAASVAALAEREASR